MYGKRWLPQITSQSYDMGLVTWAFGSVAALSGEIALALVNSSNQSFHHTLPSA